MSDRIGPMAWGSQGAVFLGEDLVHTRDYSDETARVIDEEVERILRDEENRARKVLGEYRAGLEAVARALLERETLDGDEVGSPRRRRDGPQGRRPAPLRARRRHRGRRRAAPRGRVAQRQSPSSPARPPRRHERYSDSLTPVAQSSVPIAGSGLAPGARGLGHRGPEVGGAERADERAPHHAVGVGDDGHRDRGDLVAPVEVAASLGFDLARRDRRSTRAPRASAADRDTSRTPSTRTARPATARRDAGSRRGRAGAGTGYTSRGGASGLRRRRSHAIASTTTRIATPIASAARHQPELAGDSRGSPA